MAQNIDMKFQEKAKSEPLNKRFIDITGPSILSGYRIQKGSTNFSISLGRGGYNSSVAITPSGARVEETTDLANVIVLDPNVQMSGTPRIDSIFLRYQWGTIDGEATYVAIQGNNGLPAENPDIKSHLFLGYVYVYPNSQAIRQQDIVSNPYGFKDLKVAGSSLFHGPAVYKNDVVFEGNVQFNGSSGGSGGESSFIKRLPTPIVASPGQKEFGLPSSYAMNTQTLFVYKNGQLQPPSEWYEVDNMHFSFFEPMSGGEEIWAFWYENLSLYTPAEHNHDDMYYRKWEIANRSVRYATDYFAGSNGRSVTHYIGHTDYVVVAVVPIEKSNNVGEITVEKRPNEIIVYNTGSYRGKFDLSYMVKASYSTNSPSGNQEGDFNIEASQFDSGGRVYEIVKYKRRDGTVYMQSSLSAKNAQGKFSRVRMDYFNTDGTHIVETRIWALSYDQMGNITEKILIQ